MIESERLQRFKEQNHSEQSENDDKKLSQKILHLLDHPKIDEYCMVDAYYYDNSIIPDAIQNSLNLYRDAYMIFGISHDGEMISKWVDRYDLDRYNDHGIQKDQSL